MRRIMMLVVAAITPIAGAVVASAPGVSAAPAAPTRESAELAGVGALEFGGCDDPTLQAFGAECGLLTVPLDYADPSGRKIQIAVSRVRHTVPDDEYQGVMLVNPGGPGGSGLIYAVLGAFVPGGVGAAYDWIGFDPRGVGSSVPALRCDPDYFAPVRPPYDPTTPDIEEAWLSLAMTYAADCQRAGGDLLDHLSTHDNVKDMNSIRSALGVGKINFYGFSYGTYLGQVYATQYPHRVRRMVLDSNVDPRRVWYQANLDQDRAFQTVSEVFFDWVARNDATYGLGATQAEVSDAYYAALAELAAAPQGDLGAAEWADAFLGVGYGQYLWTVTAEAFAAFVNDGDPTPALELFLGSVDTTDDNSYAMYLATICTDANWPALWSTSRADNVAVAADNPFLTWSNAWFNAPCHYWSGEVRGRPTVADRGAPPILLLSETLDAATPFSGSLEVRRRFRSSALIATEGGTTHANSLFGGNACVDDQVAAYLLDGTLPVRIKGFRADSVCAATPEPVPNSGAVARTSAESADLLSQIRPRRS